jgi:hypothetical protein
MRSASSSLKAIGAPDLHFSLVNQAVFYRSGQIGDAASDGQGWLAMTKADKALVILLRIVGVPALFALSAGVILQDASGTGFVNGVKMRTACG